LVLVLISFLVSVAAVWLVLPMVNSFTGQELDFRSLLSYQVILASLGLILIMALLSGIYPAIYLSRLQLIDALRGRMVKLSIGNQYLRKGVVILQFSISIALIISTLTMYRQLQYASTKNLGYQKENIICISLYRLILGENFNWVTKVQTFKSELLSHPDIVAVSASSGIPSSLGWSNIPTWEGQDENDNPFFYRMIVDYDFLDLYNIEIKDGRNFSRHMGTDDGHAYILNNAAVERLGFQSPVGAKFGFDGQLGIVVGVTNDFYFESLHKPITPIGIGVKDDFICHFISIRIRNNNIPKIMDHIEDAWKNFVPATPLDYSFFDERLERLYGKERQLTKSMNYLSLMALIISCLGIFGLMSFSLKERTKEIGIRKVMGASFVRLLRLILWDIVSIIGIAAVVGGILGWYISADWLKNFACRFSLGINVIIIAFIFTFFVAMIPLSLILVKSVSTNPANSLRTE